MQQDHLLYATQGQTDVQLTHELIYGESLLSYHAKSCRQNLKAESQLDIVPTQINSNTFTVLYQGKAVADVEVTVFSPQFWLKIHHQRPRPDYHCHAMERSICH